MPTPGDDESFHIKSKEFHALFVATKDFDKKLYANLRKGLRDAAKPIVDDVKSEIDNIPSSGKYGTGVRDGLKAGTRAGILASSAKTAGVRIVTSPNKLPAAKRPLAKAFNRKKGSFRHPVFANPDQVRDSRTRFARALMRIRRQDPGSWVWVDQPGRPYFGEVIKQHFDEVRKEMQDAYLRTAAELPNYEGPTT